MSDFLSQDQIDDLLNQHASGAFGTESVNDLGSNQDDAAPSADYNALTAAFEEFNQQAGSVISTVLNKQITLSIVSCEPLNPEPVKAGVPQPLLAITLPLSGGIKGTSSVIISTKQVAVLSDLMMMGDGKAEYTADHIDAIGELFNQVLGAFSSVCGERCGSPVSAGTIAVTEVNTFDPAAFPGSNDMVIENTDMGDNGQMQFAVILPVDVSAQFMDAFKGAGGSGETGAAGGAGLSTGELNDLSGITGGVMDDLGGESGFHETPLTGSPIQAPKENIGMLLDVELDVSIELGKTDLSIKRILELAPGSIVELDRMAGEPVDLMVNNKVVAKGEVVVVDESFGIRIVSLVSPEERIKSLR